MIEILCVKFSELFSKLFSELPTAILTSLITSFVVWICSLLILSEQKIKIHNRIVHDINVSKDGEKWVYKFKIINSSRLAEMYEFDIELIGVKIIINKFDGTPTEHLDLLATPNTDHSQGLKYDKLLVLGKHKNFLEILLGRKIRKNDYTINFVFRIITSLPLDDFFKKYDKLRLTVKYKDFLFNRTHIKHKDFDCKKDEIFAGFFPNDGSIRKVLPHPMSVIDKKI